MTEPVIAAPGRRRTPPWWVAFAVVAAGCVAGAVLARSSWWGPAFAVSVAGLMVTARGRVPASYRPGWTRSTVLVTLGAACAGGAYAFAVPPWGPRTALSWGFFLVPVVVVAGITAGDLGFGRSGVATKLQMLERDVGAADRFRRR